MIRYTPRDTKGTIRYNKMIEARDSSKVYSMTSEGEAKAVYEHAPKPNKTTASEEIASDVDTFLASGGHIQEIPSNLHRTPEELGLIAASQRNSLNAKQLRAHRKRMVEFSAKTAGLMHLTNRSELSDTVK